MSKRKKKEAADFRYDTGPARVPWAAVGEAFNQEDINDMLSFLCPAAPHRQKKYKAQFQRVRRELDKLLALSQPANKLSLGSRVEALEKQVCQMLKTKYAVFLTNATAGFEIAYKYAGLKPGDEVIAPAITFIATIVYPLSIGADMERPLSSHNI